MEFVELVAAFRCRDSHLDADELAPVFHLLHPGEHEYARMQVLLFRLQYSISTNNQPRPHSGH
jgi:hypothetical protein